MFKNNLSKNRFRELYYFCLQYQEWDKEIQNCSDKERRAVLQENRQLIEETALGVGGDLAPWLLEGVTNKHATYPWLCNKMDMPCGRTLFYDLRRKFYHQLSRLRK